MNYQTAVALLAMLDFMIEHQEASGKFREAMLASLKSGKDFSIETVKDAEAYATQAYDHWDSASTQVLATAPFQP